MRLAVAAFTAALLFAGCGSEARDEAREDVASPPSVAELVCSDEGPKLLTRVVRAQADGVHVEVVNENDHEVELDYEVTSGDTGGGGSVAPPGRSTHVIPFAAETVSLGCAAEALHRVELRVSDPADELKAADPQCEDLRSEEFTAVADDPVTAARSYLRGRGLRRTDRVEKAVSIAGEFPVVRVVRDGRVVAKLIFDRGGAQLGGTVEMCADFAE